MNYICFITLQRRGGEKILVSPKFCDEGDAFIFLDELLSNIGYFMRFYASHNQYLFYNDDFILAVEPEEHCEHLSFETTLVSGPKLFDMCFEKALSFIGEKNTTK